jgi:hypothetical protein
MTAPPLRRRSRIAHFKTPFIVSVAVPAVFGVACGGRAGSLEQEAGTERETDGTVNTATNPSAPILVTGVPTCSGEPPRTYTACSLTPYCEDGEWVVSYVTCNPPFVVLDTCPTAEPAGGTSCAGYSPGLTCDYAYCYGLSPTVRCSEASGLWEGLPLPSCNPPPPEPECPSVPPALGAGCYYEGQSCTYGSCHDPRNSDPFRTCTAGVWQSSELPCPPRDVDAGASDAGN